MRLVETALRLGQFPETLFGDHGDAMAWHSRSPTIQIEQFLAFHFQPSRSGACSPTTRTSVEACDPALKNASGAFEQLCRGTAQHG